MKTILRNLGAALLGVALFAGACLTTSAQSTGTYVVPRPVTLFSGGITNSQSGTYYFTNWLNPVGFHYITLWASSANTNASGTNVVTVTVNQSLGTGNGYTNFLLGTNYAFTTTTPLTWTITTAGAVTNLYETNMAAALADGVYSFQVKIAATVTNTAYTAPFQLDVGLTP